MYTYDIVHYSPAIRCISTLAVRSAFVHEINSASKNQQLLTFDTYCTACHKSKLQSDRSTVYLPGRAHLVLQLQLSVLYAIHELRSPLYVRLCLHAVIVLKEKARHADHLVGSCFLWHMAAP